MFDNARSGFFLFIKDRKRILLVSITSLTIVFFSACATIRSSPQVKQEEKAASFIPGNAEETKLTANVKTILWTVECEAESGKICAGQITLNFPPKMEYCRHDTQILEGPAGETAQVVTVDSRSSLKVNIQAMGGESGNPHPSRIAVKVRGIAIPKGSEPETRKALHCNPITFPDNK